MRLIKELIHRRIPHIIGSYLIAGTSLILFVDWLVNRYTLPEYYTTLCLFGVIAIMPSVIILTYFHGAPGKDEWTKIEKIGVPVNIIFILFVLLIGHRSNWWFEENTDNILRNFYIHVTSNDDYIKNYYIDYGYGSVNFYDKNEYIVSSIEDSLLDKIKNKLFKSVSSEYANQDVNIETSFANSEVEAINKLYFPKIPESDLSSEQIDSLQILIKNIEKILNKRIQYYDGGLPDVMIRYFIYKLTNLNTEEESYFMEEAATWGESFRKRATLQWSPYNDKYQIDDDGIRELTKKLISICEGKIGNLRYGGMIGKVIEQLDYETVKIKQKKLGLLKKKMKLSTKREYHWAKGGAETKIEDYQQLVDYFENTDSRKVWKFYNADSLDPEFEAYDVGEWEDYNTRNIKQLRIYIKDIKEKLENKFYDVNTSSDHDDMSYEMEVIEVQDSIAYAKIIGSRYPVYKVRENDMIYISK